MNANYLKLTLCSVLILTAKCFVCAHTIKTEPVTFALTEGDPRGTMELSSVETIVYDNARGLRGAVHFEKKEIGDEISIKADKRKIKILNQIQFEYFAALNTFQSGQSCIFRIYLNKSTQIGDSEFKEPGQKIFQSDSFKLKNGYQMVTLSELQIVVPNGTESITWSVDFHGLSSIGKVGLMLNEKPQVGSSTQNYWANKGTTQNPLWELGKEESTTFNFSARITGQDVPPAIHIDKNNIKSGSVLEVKFDHGPGNLLDWIGIYKEDIIPGAQAPLAWKYVNESSDNINEVSMEGTIHFVADLTPGGYKVILFLDDTFEVLDRKDFIILETPPAITQFTGPVLSVEFDNIKMSVMALGTEPLLYQWSKGGVALVDETRPTLALYKVTIADAGNYQVKVSNGAGQVESDFINLVVLQPPSIVSEPKGGSVMEGENFEFSIEANGTRPIIYQWYHAGQALDGETKNVLNLVNVNTGNTGNYHVEVSNSAKVVSSDTVTLNVEPVPVPSLKTGRYVDLFKYNPSEINPALLNVIYVIWGYENKIEYQLQTSYNLNGAWIDIPSADIESDESEMSNTYWTESTEESQFFRIKSRD